MSDRGIAVEHRRRSVVDLPPREDLEVDLQVVAAGAWMALLLGASADLVATNLGLQMGFYEQNPLGRYAVEQAGFLGLAAVKGLGVALAGLGTLVVWRVADWLSLYVPAGVGALWAAAAFWNSLLMAGVIA